ncbi:hypothetical protein WN943_019158 [Citrus x changshan-huyou]
MSLEVWVTGRCGKGWVTFLEHLSGWGRGSCNQTLMNSLAYLFGFIEVSVLAEGELTSLFGEIHLPKVASVPSRATSSMSIIYALGRVKELAPPSSSFNTPVEPYLRSYSQ